MNRVKTLLTKGALLALGLVLFTGGVHGELTDRSLMLAGGAVASARHHHIYDGITANEYASIDTGASTDTADVAWAPCGNVYATAQSLSGSSEVFVYEVLDTGPVLRDSSINSDVSFNTVGWSYDNQFLASGRSTSTGAELIVSKYTNRYNPSGFFLTSVASFEIGANVISVDWRPDDTQLAIGKSTGSPNVLLEDEVVVFSFDGSSLTLEDTFDHGAQINEVAWRPDGDFLAVPREDGSGGRQIWFVEWELSDWSKVTDDPYYHHTGLSWSPDGRKLALMLAPVEQEKPGAEVHVLNPESGEMTLISNRAFLPEWLP